MADPAHNEPSESTNPQAASVEALEARFEEASINDGTPGAAAPATRFTDGEINKALLDGVQSNYKLRIAPSKIPGAGWGVFALEDIPAGVEIFCTKQPLATTSSTPEDLPTTCDNCLIKVTSLVHRSGRFKWEESDDDGRPVQFSKCSRCKFVYYCSKGCQISAWNSHHKYECPMIRKYPEIKISYRMIFRLLLKRKAGLIPDVMWAALQRMRSNTEQFQRASSQMLKWRYIAQLAKVAMGSDETIGAILLVRCQIKICEMGIEEFHGILNLRRPASMVLDLMAATVNHSCDRNSVYQYSSSGLHMRSYRSIEAGDELTIVYTDPNLPVALRRLMLKQEHFIECCSCPRCQMDVQAPTNDFFSTNFASFSELAQLTVDNCSDSKALKTLLGFVFKTNPQIYSIEHDISRVRIFFRLVHIMHTIKAKILGTSTLRLRQEDKSLRQFLPALQNLQVLYAFVLLQDMTKCLGDEAAVTKAMARHYKAVLEAHGEKMSTGAEMAEKQALVRTQQAELLRWAGIQSSVYADDVVNNKFAEAMSQGFEI